MWFIIDEDTVLKEHNISMLFDGFNHIKRASPLLKRYSSTQPTQLIHTHHANIIFHLYQLSRVWK